MINLTVGFGIVIGVIVTLLLYPVVQDLRGRWKRRVPRRHRRLKGWHDPDGMFYLDETEAAHLKDKQP